MRSPGGDPDLIRPCRPHWLLDVGLLLRGGCFGSPVRDEVESACFSCCRCASLLREAELLHDPLEPNGSADRIEHRIAQ
jgi:hypothetical protein